MRKDDKKEEIMKYLKELESILPTDIKEYKNSIKQRAYCERYFERIIEAVVDLVFIIIKEEELSIPDDDESSFHVLKDAGLISEEICGKLGAAKGMRNIIAHEYGEIDDEKVFHAVTEELIPDVNKFLEEINER